MKYNKCFSALLACFAMLCLASCVRNTTSKSATSKSAKAKKETPEADKTKVLAETKKVDTKTKTTTKETVTTETTEVVLDKPEKSYVPLPSQAVSDIFKKEYPDAASVIWDDVAADAKNGKLYMANFLLGDTKNQAFYTEKGVVVEKRSAIMPEQLPQNVHDAIKNKYADAQILSATTLRSSRTKGEYTARIKSEAFATEAEFILTDKGVFVEK